MFVYDFNDKLFCLCKINVNDPKSKNILIHYIYIIYSNLNFPQFYYKNKTLIDLEIL